MSTVQEITITNCGPVKHVSIPVPEDGGLVVLRGRNGAGKTKTIEAVETALTGRGKVDVRDGELRGEVEAFGAKLTVGRSTRRSGELVVDTLDGKLSLSDLIDPGLKSPDAADARRIKALVGLGNTLPSAELFYPLLGGREQFEAVVGSTALASDDLVTMAERIKRDCEAKARQEESQAEHAEGRARGAREATAGVDLKAKSDAIELQGELEAAIREESTLKARKDAADRAVLANKRAQDVLDDAQTAYDGPTVDEAQKAREEARRVATKKAEAVLTAEEALRVARAENAAANAALDKATNAHHHAQEHEKAMAQWRAQLAEALPVAPTAEQLDEAAQRVTEARLANDRGVLARKALQQLAEGDKHAQAAAEHRKRAAQLREAAHGTDEVLSEIIAKSGSPLRVEHGRLVLTTKRGNTYFHDLSAGERSRLAVDIGIDAVGSKGVLTLSQEIFEGLDPKNRLALAEHATGRGVVILTAEASDDEEIQAEVYGSN